ncbi:MAG: MBL fold metallo-hydrolase [Acidobacteriota bacterium]
MRRSAVLAALVAFGLGAIGLTAAQRPAAPRVVDIDKLGDNLYMLRGGGGNTAAFVTATGVVLVDTKLPGWGQPLLDAVKTITDRPVTTVINTHTHFDHTNGQVEFPPTVDIVAHEHTKTYMEQANPVYGLQSGPQPNPFKDAGGRGYPKRTFADRMTIGTGAERVELYYFGRAHTGGDAYVVFPAHRTMHVGDTFPTKDLPIIDVNNGGSAVTFADTLAAAAAVPGVDVIINGHTDKPTTRADLEEYAAFVRAFVSTMQEAKKAGRTIDEAIASWQTPPTFAGYAKPNPARVKANAEIVWKETP